MWAQFQPCKDKDKELGLKYGTNVTDLTYHNYSVSNHTLNSSLQFTLCS